MYHLRLPLRTRLHQSGQHSGRISSGRKRRSGIAGRIRNHICRTHSACFTLANAIATAAGLTYGDGMSQYRIRKTCCRRTRRTSHQDTPGFRFPTPAAASKTATAIESAINSLLSRIINQPKPSTDAEQYLYTICSSLRSSYFTTATPTRTLRLHRQCRQARHHRSVEIRNPHRRHIQYHKPRRRVIHEPCRITQHPDQTIRFRTIHRLDHKP